MSGGHETTGGAGAGAVCKSVDSADGGSGLAGRVMHASIVRAVCAIQKSLESVRKSQRNQHGGYHFASTDDIYAALTRKMGEVGLVALAIEENAEIVRVEKDGKTAQWLKATFGFVLATEEASYEHPSMRRTLYIQVTGPQTFQAAQSYAEKSFLRSLFKLPTGDLDLDAMPQGDTEEDQIALAGGRKRKSSAEGKRDGSVKLFNEIRAAIANSSSAEMLRHLRSSTYANDWAEMPSSWAATLDEEYEVRLDEFSAMAA